MKFKKGDLVMLVPAGEGADAAFVWSVCENYTGIALVSGYHAGQVMLWINECYIGNQPGHGWAFQEDELELLDRDPTLLEEE